MVRFNWEDLFIMFGQYDVVYFHVRPDVDECSWCHAMSGNVMSCFKLCIHSARPMRLHRCARARVEERRRRCTVTSRSEPK